MRGVEGVLAGYVRAVGAVSRWIVGLLRIASPMSAYRILWK
jgi:hypothetical protein